MTRDEMLDLRRIVLKGDPPYNVDQMGNFVRERGGTPGLEELKKVGDYFPGASTLRLSLEANLRLIDHLLERMRKP